MNEGKLLINTVDLIETILSNLKTGKRYSIEAVFLTTEETITLLLSCGNNLIGKCYHFEYMLPISNKDFFNELFKRGYIIRYMNG